MTFLNPITYKEPSTSFKDSLFRNIESYFFLAGERAYVVGKTNDGLRDKVILAWEERPLGERILKVLSYCLLVPLLLLVVKKALRDSHTFKVIDAQKKLEKKINITPEIVKNIVDVMPILQNPAVDDKIIWLSAAYYLIFKLPQYPGLVFKIKHPDSHVDIDKRFENMVRGKKVVLFDNLDQLVIPHAQKFDVSYNGKKYTLIAEECLDIEFHESKQDAIFEERARELSEPLRQLIIFISKTFYNDVNWRNNPILNGPGKARIGLVDIDNMDSNYTGITGEPGVFGNGSRGLIGCVGEDQIDDVIEEALKQGITIPENEVREAKARRIAEIKQNRLVEQRYKAQNVVTGREPLNVNIDELGLNLNEERTFTAFGETNFVKKTVTLKEMVELVITEINIQIKASPDIATVRGKREIYLDRDRGLFKDYKNFGLSVGFQDLWVTDILNALATKELIMIKDIGSKRIQVQA